MIAEQDDVHHERAPGNRTLVPPFDAEQFARDLDLAAEQTMPGASSTNEDLPTAQATIANLPGRSSAPFADGEPDVIRRRMFQCYIDSSYPAALSLAEQLMERVPFDELARVVAARSRSAIAARRLRASAPPLEMSAVLRLSTPPQELRSLPLDPTSAFVLWHVDGVSNADTIVALTGIPRTEAISRLETLLELGLVEVVPAHIA